MNPAIHNPYGAVPEALKEARLSLSDIMKDFLMTKKMEQDLSLAQAKAATETALVGAGMERDRLVNLRDMAHQEQQQRQFDVTADLHQAQLAEQKRHALADEAHGERSLAELARHNEATERQGAAGLSLQQQFHAGSKPGKAKDLMTRAFPTISGEHRTRILDAAGIDPEAVTTADELRQYQRYLLPIQQKLLNEDFQEITRKYDQSQDAKERKTLAAAADRIATQVKQIDEFLTKELTPEGAAKIFKIEEAAGRIPVGQTFTDFYQNLQVVRDHSSAAKKQLQTAAQLRLAADRGGALKDPEAVQTHRDLLTQFGNLRQETGWKEGVVKQYQKKIDAGDSRGAAMFLSQMIEVGKRQPAAAAKKEGGGFAVDSGI
jgi:hypothetical protein